MTDDLKNVIASGSMEAATPIIEAMSDKQLDALEKDIDAYYEAECKRIDEVWECKQFTPAAFFNNKISKALRDHADTAKITVLAITSEISVVVQIVRQSRKGTNEQKG